jgi:hypothetical protein
VSVSYSGCGVPLPVPHFALVPAFLVHLLSTSHYQIFPNHIRTVGFGFKFSVPMVTHLPVILDVRVKHYLQNHLESLGLAPSPPLCQFADCFSRRRACCTELLCFQAWNHAFSSDSQVRKSRHFKTWEEHKME